MDASQRHIARWDLDKTYLRTEFDTLRDLVRTALERPDEKRTNPGAATLLREMVRAGISVHILSGSPEQMRRRLEDKLRLDGITWDSFTLKPNLKNVLKLRFRALRDQLGYKLPALLHARALLDHATKLSPARAPEEEASQEGNGRVLCRETLFGDDAEADAFVYSLYSDIVSGHVSPETLLEICERGRVYPDVIDRVMRDANLIVPGEAVERILIHLERQTPPDDFHVYGARAVPFYNYLQAAFVVHEDQRLPADAVLRVGVELVVQHRFDGDALARSYLELARRGHLRGTGVDDLSTAFERYDDRLPGHAELRRMVERLPQAANAARASWRGPDQRLPDYLALVAHHNPRRRGR
ncbi:hypothetical protein LVJ94_04490 [Pendulispora rubella]|uniref:HAD family hydrolase n=1 Tax=Pendulispora rubella TaxID=2741070 RepID=A0ABZ2L6D0_9BACT